MRAISSKNETDLKKVLPFKAPDILDVESTAKFLAVSKDTVYSLFQKGEMPGRKVGRKWKTTKSAVLRWLENTTTEDSLARAVERGDTDALQEALKSGKVKVQSRTVP